MSVPAQTPISGPYIANGITTQFTYSFYLIYETDIQVWVGGILKTLNTDFTVTGVGNSQGGNIEFIVPPAATLEILIKRSTPYNRQTNYADNGDFLATVVNEDFDRLWLALQEIFANFSSSISKPVGGNWNAQGLRITTVKDGVQPQDVATINQLNIVNGSAGQSAASAAASAVAAALSEQHALASENAAKLSENNAKTSENNAKTSETNAKTSETNAKTSETNAAASELSSSNSKVAAQAAQAAACAAAAAAQTANPDNQLKKAQNLADLPDKSASRGNLSVYSIAEINSKLGYALVDFGTVGVNARYVQANPFGNSTPVICQVEIYFNGKWGAPGWLGWYDNPTMNTYGLSGGMVLGEGLVVQTARFSLEAPSNNTGSLVGTTAVIVTTVIPCRMHVWKLVP
ncbi:phage tail fiber protein [Enterobacter roggenkampii]|uniref:phage tail fiber domain-containing protein n=1 Tax=Enterobacter roggenkampii TaxID=1812935 RepID=UPI00321A5F8F